MEVLIEKCEGPFMDELTRLPNIGPVLAAKLKQIGVHSFDQLVEIGCVEALLRIGERDESACYNMLYALEGAVRGIRWHAIPKDDREKIKVEFRQALSG
ncbi:MAG: TfoX/Sxy family protein [Anaerolineales bacterium]|nr:TfoX/Sxy family protein [Anaerolineales bacterium]